jgi:hypothetical protein
VANKKITDLTALSATPADADILEIVDDVAGTPTSKKITAGNLRGGLAASGANADITSMTGLSNDGIPLAKVANAASDGANSDITSLSAVSIPTINLTGGQIAFPATAVPSADANTLDDYEEGTWTLTVTCGTSGTVTLAAAQNTGAYTKNGRIISIQGRFTVDSVSSPVGSIAINVPFSSAAQTELEMRSVGNVNLADINYVATGWVSAFITGSANSFALKGTNDNAASNNETAAIFKATSAVIFQLTYTGV